MGKRSSSFERQPRDFYPTPLKATLPLLEYLPYVTFCEPCAGDGSLVRHLEKHHSKCLAQFDIHPMANGIESKDALSLTKEDINGASCIITNPPWDRGILHPLITHFSSLVPSWLLFDADWSHTKQSTQFMSKCATILSVGRVKWIENSKHTGKDNCCWYQFVPYKVNSTEFIGRH